MMYDALQSTDLISIKSSFYIFKNFKINLFLTAGESFETSVPWTKVLNLCKNVKTLLVLEARKRGIEQHILATCR